MLNPGENYTLSLAANGTGLSYQWYQLETNSNSLGGTAIAAAKDSAFTTSKATAGDYTYYCLVTNTTATGLTAITRSNAVTVTVKADTSWVLSNTQTGSGTLAAAITACNAEPNGGTITLLENLTLNLPVIISKNITLISDGSNQITRGENLNDVDMFKVVGDGTLALGRSGGMGENNALILDGGAVWTGTSDPILGRGTMNNTTGIIPYL